MKNMCVAGFCYHVMMLITTRELSYFDITIIIDYVLYFFARNKPKINWGFVSLLRVLSPTTLPPPYHIPTAHVLYVLSCFW